MPDSLPPNHPQRAPRLDEFRRATQAQPAPAEAPKPLAQSLTVRSALLGAALLILGTLIDSGVLLGGLEATARSQISGVLVSLAAVFGVGVAVGARRAIGALLLAASLALAGCCSHPDLRPTLAPLDRAFARIETRLTTPSPARTPDEHKAIDAADLSLVRQARRTIAAARGPGAR